MRTLLNESLPPHCNDDTPISQPQKNPSLRRIFSENALLFTNEPKEVGVDGAVIASPGASADSARSAPGGGLSGSRAGLEPFNESPAL